MKKLLLSILAASALAATASAQPYSWQTQQAKVLPSGEIEWAPKPFSFTAGQVVRFIDFEGGDDTADGSSKTSAWKHHPWDPNATGSAATHEGPTTYVFKRGVIYRGELVADESGEPGNPIRLTASAMEASSPYFWGEGEAALFGSTRLPAQWVKANTVAYPARLPEPEKVWAIDLKALGLAAESGAIAASNATHHWVKEVKAPWIGLHYIDADGKSQHLHLARTPDWQPGDPNFTLDYWHQMDGGIFPKDENGKKIEKAIVDDFLAGHPKDYFVGGYIWPQYGHFMGAPMARELTATFKAKNKQEYPMYDPELGAIYQGTYGQWDNRLRYMIDNLPQFLDAAGEFYHDSSTGILYLRTDPGINPNQLLIELSNLSTGVTIPSKSHIVVDGLTFRYYNNTAVTMDRNVANLRLENCMFEDILGNAVFLSFGNWRVAPDPEFADNIYITDCYFQDIWTTAIQMENTNPSRDKVLGHVEILRNKTSNTGIRHKDNVQTPLPSINLRYMQTAEVAGNVVENSWGSGLMVFGGTPGGGGSQAEIPLNRILVYQNKTLNTAQAVNDYGGMSLWQGGPIYCYNNNIGNSTGVMPAWITMFGTGKPQRNLSYPLYLDGAYKVYSFNNIIWARANDPQLDEFATSTPGYLMVFGFLNQFTNNTLYRTGEGVGGSSGHRNDVVSNLMAQVGGNKKNPAFIAHDRAGDPSLVGGGDDGTSGQRGVPTLAYSHNVFHGDAIAGKLLRGTEMTEGIEADDVAVLSQKMQTYPIRDGSLGFETQEKPIIGKDESQPIMDGSDADFRPTPTSAAIDKGATYYVPWGLYGTVGEWHFTENHADPRRQIDYSWYMSDVHFHRMYYEFVPPLDLIFNELTSDGYAESSIEDWTKGAVVFNGERFASIQDAFVRDDVIIPIYTKNKRGETQKIEALPAKGWLVPTPTKGDLEKDKVSKLEFAEDAVIRYPAELRHTLAIRDENVLIEALLSTEPGLADAGVAGKFDGTSGYRLIVNAKGQAEFQAASGSKITSVTSSSKINDGKFHYVVAELDRASGRMTIYVDGVETGSTTGGPSKDQSLDNPSDFLVGKTHDGKFFKGKLDTLRVCQGTLEDSRTTIGELYTWLTDGPWRYDMVGNKPVGRRDAGAIERVE